jgi:restriction endonuclease S subunit
LGNYAEVSESDIPSFLNQRVGRFLPKANLDRVFLKYLLQSKLFTEQLLVDVTGTAQFNISPGQVGNIRAPLPDKRTQSQIAGFLNRETAKIDRLMEVRRKQVDRLQEQRTAVIHHAVTRGLDANAKMKPSGVEWLGNVPDSWEVGDVKHFAKFSVGWTPPTGQDDLYDGDFPWCTIADMKSDVVYDTSTTISAAGIAGSRMAITPKGSLLFSFKLSIGQVSFAGVDMFTNEAIASFPVQNGFSPRFMFYAFPIFIVENAQTNIYGAKLLNQFLIKNAPMVRPPMSDQETIVAHIERETAKLDTLVAKYRRELELLAEYRASLISHAVTGRIDVRGMVPIEGAA